MTRALATTVLIFSLGALPAAAAERGLYLSVKLGTTDLDAGLGTAFQQVVDGGDDSFAYEAGFRFSRHWAIQAAHHDFGRASGIGSACSAEVCAAVVTPVTAESTGTSLSLLPQLPLGKRLSLFGKIGIIAWESDIAAASPADGIQSGVSEEDVLWGVGARLALLGPFEIFYEYEGVGDELETQAFGLTFQF